MKTLILLRGLPGSGKSTFAKLLANRPGINHYEADMFFIDPKTKEYKFDASKIEEAHNWCKEEVLIDMSWEIDTIIVSNTFTKEWEMEPYYEFAKEYGYQVYSIIVENRHGGKNIHECPLETIERMRDRFKIKL